jgi:lysozyme
MYPSAEYIKYLKAAEVFSPRAYLDPKGNTYGQYSTAYGHLIGRNERYLIGKVFTEPEATALLMADLKQFIDATNAAIKRPVSQKQFEAMLDTAYNAGPGRMADIARVWNNTGSVADTVTQIKKTAITVQIEKGVHVVDNGLIKRREHAALWFGGLASPAISQVETLVEKKNLIYYQLWAA